MPFASERQRRFMHARHPDIAARWEHEAKSSAVPAVRKKKAYAKKAAAMKKHG